MLSALHFLQCVLDKREQRRVYILCVIESYVLSTIVNLSDNTLIGYIIVVSLKPTLHRPSLLNKTTVTNIVCVTRDRKRSKSVEVVNVVCQVQAHAHNNHTMCYTVDAQQNQIKGC